MAGNTIGQRLADEIGGTFVQKKSYARIAMGRRTLAYVNATYLDFKAADVAKAPKAARAKLTEKGTRAHLPLTEVKAAGTLLKHVAQVTS